MAESPLFLKSHRDAVGLSVAELAVKAGVAKTTVYRLEAGEVEGISWKTLRQLADALGVDVDALFRASEPAP